MSGGRAGRISPLRHRRLGLALILACGLGVAAFGYFKFQDRRLETRLMAIGPDEAAADPALVRFASRKAAPAFAKSCAACHGADLRGDRDRGAPNLTDADWLFGEGRVADIERTILYGVRSSHRRSRHVPDMPAFGRTGLLSRAEIEDAMIYVYAVAGLPGDGDAIQRGELIYDGKGGCWVCHGEDGQGDPSSGAPRLSDKIWLYGSGDPETLRMSIYDGRRGVCPGYIGKLPPATIRALALYIHAASHREPR
ncbi:MAG: c-type cytochrome [Caulobacteraceae bacterium]